MTHETYKFSDDQLMKALRETVADRPGYVYESPYESGPHPSSCYYVHGDKPGCGVGAALHRLGVPLRVLGEYENNAADTLINALGMTGDTPARRVYVLFQGHQDNGIPWGEALELAEHGERHPNA